MALTGLNITFPIKNADGTAFHNLVLRKATVNSVVMSLGDKITGDVYYKDNTLAVTMQEYIEYDGVRYSLVNPPTIVREGMVSDNSELKGMTKYSFEFYHPMYMLGNFPFSDIAVNSSQEKYLSQNKTFSWIGYLVDFVAKINKNLEGTQWIVVVGSSVQQDILTKLSDVLSFDNTTIADALKTGYETWEVPYVVDTIASDSAYYAQGKRFMVQYGLPTTEIVDGDGNPFVFHFGKGVGLKNNSRTPRNNKIITRIAGYGSENNIPYGYPQIVWTGNQDWDYTINNDPTAENSYPIYKGIVGGAYVKLIKHPFTRNHLMPSIYSETVNKKVNPYAIGYDPTTEIKDYYDADNTYDNPIKAGEPSYEIHAFEDIKPELTSAYSLQAVVPYDQHAASQDFVTKSSFLGSVLDRATSTEIALERAQMLALYNSINNDTAYNSSGSDDSYEYSCATTSNSGYFTVIYKSSNFNFTSVIQITQQSPEWDDTMDEDGNYVQSYFQITLPQLTFDIYACAAITEEMKINMRSGACIGCTFPVQVDWDDYKKNFYDSDGNFAPTGAQRDYTKYPDSSQDSITILVQKENDTFGTLMPNIYQKPQSGDKFVILGISLPLSYITSAESRLDDEMKAYMRENNVYYYDYPLKFDEHFLATYTSVLNQMKNNVLVRFDYAGTQHALYIKQMTVKYGDNPLPQYDITLTDDIEVVLNQIGQAVEDISNLHSLLSEQQQKTLSLSELDARYIRKDIDDDAAGIIRFVRGMQVGERFVTGLLGEGGIFRRDADGKTYIEADKLYIRMKAYFDTVEIRKYQHSSGNRIASNAGIRCSRVEYIDSNGNITTNVASANIFRCYFKASEDDKTITNDFVVGDLAFCSETNVNTGGLSQHRYWRAVVDKSLSADSNGEHYIDLSVSDCETGSGIPIAQDDIVQLGNKTDTTRQGAIIEFISGGDAPSYQIYQGINTYSLDNKNYIGMGYSSSTGRAYLNVYGDFRFGSRDNNGSYITYNASDGSLNIRAIINAQSTIGSQSIPDYIKANQNNYNDAWVHSAIDDLQSQIDGEIDSWFYNYLPVANLDSKVPLTNKEPYKTWYEADAGGTQSEVTTERTKHLGDTFYDNSSGYAFRFSLNENTNAFEWILITDSAIVQALANAAKAQETADGKRATYSTWEAWIKNNVNTLKVGDLFIPASDYPNSQNPTYKAKKVYKCITDATNDFEEINYTDDSALNAFKLDQYVQQLTNGTISSNITTAQGTADNAASAAATAQGTADNAAAAAAALGYLAQALGQDTSILGGLVLSTLIGLRDGNGRIWSGINGAYQATETGTGYKGHGIAAWYGGAMVDKEVVTTATDYAKSLFRFDGSGYLAGGNITWDKDGIVTIANVYSNVNGQPVPWSGATLQYITNLSTLLPITIQSGVTYLDPQVGFKQLSVLGETVATQAWVGNNYLSKTDASNTYLSKTDASNTYLSIAFFNRLFQAHNGNADVNANDMSSTIDSIEAMFGFWTEQYISALGQNSSGGGGGGAGDVTWDALASYSDTRQIALPHLTGALSGYATQSWVGQNYLSLSGGTITDGDYTTVINGGRLSFLYNGSGVLSCYVTNTVDGAEFYISGVPNFNNSVFVAGAVSINSACYASAFVKSGGTSSQFLKADGSVDSNAYNPTSNFKTINNQSIIGTGNINIEAGSAAPSFANNTWYNVGDDAAIGDHNIAGAFCIKGLNGTPNIRLFDNNNNLYATVITTADMAGYATTSQLDNYLPLTGGTLTGVVNFTNTHGSGSIFVDSLDYDLNITAGNSIYLNANRGVGVNGTLTAGAFEKSGGTSSQFLKADGSVDSNAYLPLSGGTMTGNLIIGGSDIPEVAVNLSNYASVHAIKFYRNGFLIPYQMDNTNDGGFFRVRGTTESSCICEIGTWDDSGVGETIQFNYYPTTSTINPTYSISVPKKSGTIALTNDFKTINGNSIVGSGDIVISGGGGNYLPLTGGTLTGNLTINSGIDNTSLYIYGASANGYGRMWIDGDGFNFDCSRGVLYFVPDSYFAGNIYFSGNVDVDGSVRATSFVKNGGTSSQFLKADGSATTLKTINGNSLEGSGDIVISGGGGNYLPLTGGTITGNLTVDGTYNSVANIKKGSSNVAYLHITNTAADKDYAEIHCSNLDNSRTDRPLVLQYGYGNVGIGVSQPSYKLQVGGTGYFSDTFTVQEIELGHSNEINSNSPDTPNLHLNYRVSGKVTICNGGGNCGIGTREPSYKLHVAGLVGATGFVNTSDLRKKTIMGDVPMNLYNVANAPLFKFTWKDEKEYSGQHIGSAAQYWQTVLPELVITGRDTEQTLAMQYDVIALASAITVARTVVSHEERITILEKENEALRKEIEKLKAA